MPARGSEKFVGLLVVISIGLEYGRAGLSPCVLKASPIHCLTLPQVSELKANTIVDVSGLTMHQVEDLLRHDAAQTCS